jgi:hypothetical protein
MRATITSTEQIVEFALSSAPEMRVGHMAQARVWVGTTESGIPVQMLVVRVAVRSGEPKAVLDQFERELKEKPAPPPGFPAFPLRMIL